jgi:RNA polymerase sigma factor (sigma-70 family)
VTPRHLLEPARLAGGALLKAQSDARLVDLTRAGNDRAFEAIVTRYKGDLLRYCSRLLPDGRGEDAVQQSFVNAHRALHRDTTPLLSLRSWLFSIAHNVSLNILRQRGGDHEPLEAHPGTAEPTHTTIERRERLREVLAAVAALPPSQRDAIVLRELEGRGHEEIARELGVTGGAARQLISRARNGIRQAAAAVMPMPLLMRLTADSAPTPTTERLAELTAVGGGVAVSKVVATGAIGATLLGGAIAVPDFVEDSKRRQQADVAEAATPDESDASRTDAYDGVPGDVASAAGDVHDRRGPGDRGSTDSSGPGSGEGDRDDERRGEDDDDDDRSGPGHGGEDDDDEDEHDSSGPGSDGDEDDADEEEHDISGPGSGEDDDADDDAEDDAEETDDAEEEEHDSSGPGSDGDGEDREESGADSGEDEPDEILEPDDDSSDDDDSESGEDSD